jgi:acetyltransferase-like isoleucine patch superfamily enzyme
MRNKFQALYYYLSLPFVLLHARWKFYFLGPAGLEQVIQTIHKNYLISILRKFGADIGNGANFNGNLTLDNIPNKHKPLSNLSIGENCFVGKNVFIDLPKEVIIEDNAILSAGVKLLTHQDCGDRPMSKYYPRKEADVRIGKNSWLGIDTIVLAGVNIGENVVVAAGSVVLHDVKASRVVAGNPAKEIKKLNSEA